VVEQGCVRHLQFAEPIRVVMNSRAGQGVIFKLKRSRARSERRESPGFVLRLSTALCEEITTGDGKIRTPHGTWTQRLMRRSQMGWKRERAG